MRCQNHRKYKVSNITTKHENGNTPKSAKNVVDDELKIKIAEMFLWLCKICQQWSKYVLFYVEFIKPGAFLPATAKRSKSCKIQNLFVNNLEGYCTMKIYLHVTTFKIIQKILSYS